MRMMSPGALLTRVFLMLMMGVTDAQTHSRDILRSARGRADWRGPFLDTPSNWNSFARYVKRTVYVLAVRLCSRILSQRSSVLQISRLNSISRTHVRTAYPFGIQARLTCIGLVIISTGERTRSTNGNLWIVWLAETPRQGLLASGNF